MEDWTSLGQHKRHPEFPVVTRESRRNSRKTTWLPRHRKMKPFPATASQEKSHVRNWRSKGHLAPLMRPTEFPEIPVSLKRNPELPASTGDEALFQCTKPSGVPRGPSHFQFPRLLRATMRSPLRSPAQGEGSQGSLPQSEKDLERPSSARLEARFPYHNSRAMTRSPSPLAWRPDFPGAPREAH